MTSAARGRTMCAPTERKRKHAVCALGLLPSGEGIAGGASPSPTILKKLFRNLVGEVLGPPADHVPAATSSATPGAGAGPQQRQFLQGQGPAARREFRHSLRFCAPKIQCQAKGVTLVMGVLGGGRHGGIAEPADCAHPLASFGSFSTWKRNPPRRAEPCKRARRGRRALRSAEMAATSPKRIKICFP